MTTSSKLQRTLAGPLCAALGVALALCLVSSGAQAQSERLYIKHNGKVAVAMFWTGDIFSRSHDNAQATETAGLQIKRNGVSIIQIGPDDPSNPERLGTISAPACSGCGQAVEPSWFQFGIHTGVLSIKGSGQTSFPIVEVDHVQNNLRTASGYYAREFGFRRDYRNLTPMQRALFNNAIWTVDNQFYPGAFGVTTGNGSNGMGAVSKWDKGGQLHDRQFPDIHDFGSFNGQGRFLPWHREFLTRLEADLRLSDPLVTLPYWNWETNPVTNWLCTDWDCSSKIFEEDEMALGQPVGRVGGFYEGFDNNGVFAGSYEESCPTLDAVGCNPAKPPQTLDRYIKEMSPIDYGIWTDAQVLAQTTFPTMRNMLEQNAHNLAHGYLCNSGEIIAGRAPEDPMFWMLHTNNDRIWAAWQKASPTTRMTAATAYGTVDDPPANPLNGNIQPWSGGTTMRPWTAPDNLQVTKSYKATSVIVPVLYN